MNIHITRWLLTTTILWMWFPTPTVHAGVPCSGYFSTPRQIVTAIQLTEAIAREPSTQRDVAFKQTEVSVPFTAGMMDVTIAANPDGTGQIVTDDHVTITNTTTGLEWQRDFRNPSHTAILPIDPTTINHIFSGISGTHLVSFAATDKMGPERRSSSYWLILWSPCPQPTPTPVATATNTVVPTAAEIPTPTPVPTATPVPVPTATATPSAVPTTADSPLAAVPSPPAAQPAPPPWDLLAVGVGFLASLVGVLLFALRSQRVLPQNNIEVRDAQTDELLEIYHLPDFNKTEITIGDGTADIWLVGVSAQRNPIARIYAQRDHDAIITMLDLLSDDEANQVTHTRILTNGHRIALEPYVLVYRHHVPVDIHESEMENPYV